MPDVLEMFNVFSDVAPQMTALDENAFMATIACLFDEYHRVHNDFDPVEKAQIVADMVKQVNDVEGEFK